MNNGEKETLKFFLLFSNIAFYRELFNLIYNTEHK